MDDAVLGVHRATFHNGKQVALHPFAAHVRSTPSITRTGGGYFVYFVDEDNSGVFGFANGFFFHLVHVDELGGFFFEQNRAGFGDGHFTFFASLGHHPANHLLDVHHRQIID